MRKQARPTGEEISGCYYICNYASLRLAFVHMVFRLDLTQSHGVSLYMIL
uniref:Uncharacterized protein n=1 Tax=Picea glauca TaxID=3330 RepID=A0A101LTQ3_PICGL|nr:hypothetical protein ABT39_MTgene3592 [Picea glauca]KUM47808.1 hypothetical protein ABT39_MTgene4802 [Picea glauca]KUM47809.1 hypothetical protein ABT39_MTgene4803 [Picea glauca]